MAILASPIDFIQSIPPVTKAFTATTILFSAAYAWLDWRSYGYRPCFLLIPGSSVFYPWTFLSSVFVEANIFQLVVSLLFIPPSLRYLERLWGSTETIKFIAFTTVASNIIAFIVNWLEYFLTSNEDLFLYGMPYYGQTALQISILVAFTQIIPEHQVQVLGILKARIKTLPMVYLTISTVLCIVYFQSPWILIQFGWFFSWVYLRFYKKFTSEVGGVDTYGDRSETFSLVSWFPPFAHYPIGMLGNFVYSLATRFHLIPNAPDVESGLYNQPGSARAEADRRRAMALKALDQHMANVSPPQPSSSSPPQRPPSNPIESSTKPTVTGDGDITDAAK